MGDLYKKKDICLLCNEMSLLQNVYNTFNKQI